MDVSIISVKQTTVMQHFPNHLCGKRKKRVKTLYNNVHK